MSNHIFFQFEIGGCFQGHKTLTIRNEQTGPTCVFECWLKPEGSDRQSMPITDAQVREIDALAMRCGVSSWNESYYAPVLDGEQWRLLWHGRKCSGSNAYPPEFDTFVAGIARVLGLPELQRARD